MTYDMILVRYGEMTLKKDNYKQFLEKIVRNIKNKLRDFKSLKFDAQPYRFYIYLNGEDHNKVIDCLNKVSGLHSYSLCKKVYKNIDSIASKAVELLNEYKSEYNVSSFTFKVETKRADKTFPMTSLEISRSVSSKVLPIVNGLKVDVHNPDVTLFIDFRFDAAYIYTNAIKGLGGYPSGIQGNGLVMMSGGLDSPVSAFLCMNKGVNISAIHFFSPPYTSYSSLQKVIDLLECLSEYSESGNIDLYVVPFTAIQDKIHECANNIYLVTLMRRAMYKIASMLVNRNHMHCIINGESIGQVASQTLNSMFVVNDVTNIPIIRPLCTYDKEDIIKIARKINTYDISIRPYEDCCTVFVPKHPVIKPNLNEIALEEKKCDLDSLIIDSFNNIKRLSVSKSNHLNAFDLDQEEDKFTI